MSRSTAGIRGLDRGVTGDTNWNTKPTEHPSTLLALSGVSRAIQGFRGLQGESEMEALWALLKSVFLQGCLLSLEGPGRSAASEPGFVTMVRLLYLCLLCFMICVSMWRLPIMYTVGKWHHQCNCARQL